MECRCYGCVTIQENNKENLSIHGIPESNQRKGKNQKHRNKIQVVFVRNIELLEKKMNYINMKCLLKFSMFYMKV
ncbi:hypothetical protein TNIN_412691 [Trichonephila inaurata madagascariensis]|uniref:Uncharacterized protein n=1 Tax=Trichonephila inaurata madagascariensis TaxID=2747483 RepID=A0A8X6XFU2_9ARAC|nr:hypothetical protein TNIN_412691 [Trichonephila inaurata madagascariensis]